MTIPPSWRLPWRIFVAVRLPYERGARATQLVAHGCRALALTPLSPHIRTDFWTAGIPLSSHSTVQRLGPLVHWLVLVLSEENRYSLAERASFSISDIVDFAYFNASMRAKYYFKYQYTYNNTMRKILIDQYKSIFFNTKLRIKISTTYQREIKSHKQQKLLFCSYCIAPSNRRLS